MLHKIALLKYLTISICKGLLSSHHFPKLGESRVKTISVKLLGSISKI